MSIDELFSIVFKHPGIPSEMQTLIFSKFCDDTLKLSFYSFIVAITLLTKKDAFNRGRLY